MLKLLTLFFVEGAVVLDADGSTVLGVVTSGIPSPTRGENIAMAYVRNGMHKKGTQLLVTVRKQERAATIVGMPFVPNKFYRG